MIEDTFCSSSIFVSNSTILRLSPLPSAELSRLFSVCWRFVLRFAVNANKCLTQQCDNNNTTIKHLFKNPWHSTKCVEVVSCQFVHKQNGSSPNASIVVLIPSRVWFEHRASISPGWPRQNYRLCTPALPHMYLFINVRKRFFSSTTTKIFMNGNLFVLWMIVIALVGILFATIAKIPTIVNVHPFCCDGCRMFSFVHSAIYAENTQKGHFLHDSNKEVRQNVILSTGIVVYL